MILCKSLPHVSHTDRWVIMSSRYFVIINCECTASQERQGLFKQSQKGQQISLSLGPSAAGQPVFSQP